MLDEAERITRLRTQDGRPLVPPASVATLLQNGALPAWKVDEAFAVWESSRAELSATSSFEAAERLLFLTLVLSNHLVEQGNLPRQRELLERALGPLTLPRHRQVIASMLSRSACRAGDHAAAERWLSQCDPRSDDLQSDSAFRAARAFLDTARDNPRGVLAVLGEGPTDVPIMDALDPLCVVLRANAWETLGEQPKATALLVHYLKVGGPSGRPAVAKAVELLPERGLCRQSYPQAVAAHSSQAGASAAARASGGVHKVFIPLGALFLVVGIASVVAMVAGMIPIAAIALPLTFTVMGAVFFVVGRAMGKAAARAERLRIHGLRGTAQILAIAPTGLRVNRVPQMRFDLMIQLEGRAPYQASTKMLVSHVMGVAPGSSVAVRVDPQNPSDVLIETD